MLFFDCFAVAQLTTKIKHLSSALHKKVRAGARSLYITVSTFFVRSTNIVYILVSKYLCGSAYVP